MRYISHREFVSLYEQGQLTVSVDQFKAGDFILSPFSKNHYKYAHYFWNLLGFILLIGGIASIFFINWTIALAAIIIGLVIISAVRKSAGTFVMEQMLDDEEFWDYILLHKGAKIHDLSGETVYSQWLKDREE